MKENISLDRKYKIIYKGNLIFKGNKNATEKSLSIYILYSTCIKLS